MKLIIDIDKKEYNKIYTMVHDNLMEFLGVPNSIDVAIANGTPIPENATNGEVVMAMFPNEHDFETDFDTEWWNAKYKAESEDRDAVSRQAVFDLAKKGVLVSNGNYKSVCKAINELPPVNPQPKTGHWIFVDKAHEHAHCSECDYGNVDLLDGRPHNYCPNCGARMESEVRNEYM